MHSFSPARVLPFLGAVLVGCADIPRAPEPTLRAELEVAVEVDPSIAGLLREPSDQQSVQRIVSSEILSLADVGLRFYPVSSASYGEPDPRPEYLLTIEIQALEAELGQRVVRSSREFSDIQTPIENLDCQAVATFVRRRPEGPSLIVGRAVGRGDSSVREASAVVSSEREFVLSAGTSGYAPSFHASDLEHAVRAAVTDALKGIVEPIDRELQQDRDVAGPRVR